MIRPLRNRHRRMMTLLAIVTPLIFALGILARKPLAVTGQAAVIESGKSLPNMIINTSDLWPGTDIHTRIYGDNHPPSRFMLALHPQTYLQHPDILVYWHNRPPANTDALPEGAYLLGTLSGTHEQTYNFSADIVSPNAGSVILYSLAHQSIVAVAEIPPLVSEIVEEQE